MLRGGIRRKDFTMKTFLKELRTQYKKLFIKDKSLVPKSFVNKFLTSTQWLINYTTKDGIENQRLHCSTYLLDTGPNR